MSIHVAIAPSKGETRVLAIGQAQDPLLKARLSLSPSHPRALPTLLEALALWQGEKVYGALIADDRVNTCETTLFTDCFAIVDPTPLFQLTIVGHIGAQDRRKPITGMGHFADLHTRLRQVRGR